MYSVATALSSLRVALDVTAGSVFENTYYIGSYFDANFMISLDSILRLLSVLTHEKTVPTRPVRVAGWWHPPYL